MIAPVLFASLFSFAGSTTDSFAIAPTDSPVTTMIPKSKEWKADSAWNREPWSFEMGYRSGIAWGDLRDAEADMADAVQLTVTSMGQTSSPVILLQDYALGIGIWHNLGNRLQMGIGYDHTWTLVNAGQSAFDLLLSMNGIQARARYWAFRRLQWQIGPKLGVGPVWGTLTRYSIEQDATFTGTSSDIAAAKAVVHAGNEDLSVTGLRVECGMAMEVRIFPAFSIGGTAQAIRLGMSVSEEDPVRSQLASIGIPFPMDPVQWEVGLELHAAYRF